MFIKSNRVLLLPGGGSDRGNTVPLRAAKDADSEGEPLFASALFLTTNKWPFTTPTVLSLIDRSRKMLANLWLPVQVKLAGRRASGQR